MFLDVSCREERVCGWSLSVVVVWVCAVWRVCAVQRACVSLNDRGSGGVLSVGSPGGSVHGSACVGLSCLHCLPAALCALPLPQRRELVCPAVVSVLCSSQQAWLGGLLE